MVYTVVLEATAERIESSSLSLGTKNKEAWQSPAYCNSLENCRLERVREFESHRFRQLKGESYVE